MTQCQGAQGARDFSPPKFFMISNTSEENNDKSFPYELNDWILPTKKKKKFGLRYYIGGWGTRVTIKTISEQKT